MPRKSPPPDPVVVIKQWGSTTEIDKGIQKLERRKAELESLDILAAIRDHNGVIEVAESNLREAIREVFGQNSPEFYEHADLSLWSSEGLRIVMSEQEAASQKLTSRDRGRREAIGILNGLIGRLREKREEIASDDTPTPTNFLHYLNLHQRISDVASVLFEDGHHWEAVFAASKTLVNLVKERSGKHDLDGAPLMRTVFSRNGPVLAFNELRDQTDADEQEGMMHLFEGVVLGVRNPGGHSFPEGPERRALEYLSLISLLAHRVQEAKRR